MGERKEMNKKTYWGIVALAFFATIVMVAAQIPDRTLTNNWLVHPNINITGDYFWRGNNITAAIEGITIIPVNEWGLVYGTTGDWFNYSVLTYTPLYIGLQMYPTNITYDEELVYPVVYDKDATHWQLALYWTNGTQITDNTDMLVMYHAHVDWTNEDGEEYTTANEAPD